jgi:predicted esterase
VLIGRGTEDDWYDQAKCAADESLLRDLGSTVEICVFDGGHVWTDDFRRWAGDFLARLSG